MMLRRPLQWKPDINKRPVPATPFENVWDLDRIIGSDIIEGVQISTVFLCIDHYFGPFFDEPNRQPTIYETMIFGLSSDGDLQWRYEYLEDAIEGHKQAVKLVQEYLKKGELPNEFR